MDMIPRKEEEEVEKEIGKWAPGFPLKPTIAPPDRYFEDLPGRMIQRWKDEMPAQRQRKITLQRWMAVAAMLTAMLIGVWWWSHHTIETVPLASISNTEAYQYVSENIQEFETLLEKQDQWPEDAGIHVPDASAIEEYLMEEFSEDDFEQLF